ncbi:universal stress protein [Tenacibaculum sp.]|uniref:universal stress protein n=1 Tax=Tenacibaculum sp. TaxID=1906242 RepID=UPI003D09DA9F
MKNILVPTDFSDCARAAEDYALKIAKKANAEIHFLHLLMTPIDWEKLPLEKEKNYPETKAQIGYADSELKKLKNRAEKLGLKAKSFLIFDKGREEIHKHIKQYKHDFVVMGSHGANGIKSIIGSNTQRVVRYSNAPVLVVKDDLKNIDIKNIVFASTFEEDVHKPFLQIKNFADIVKAKIHLLYVNMPFLFKETDEIQANMENFLKKYPKDTYSINIFNALDEERGIKKFTKSIKADMIALTTHGKKGFMRMISPSITESLVNHASVPILSVNLYNEMNEL